ncbi:MAG: hypothetical protein JNM67_03650, partial [Bacteroidetes bacterium]|nr:hypothetical protein [Bacteroidota bacterium]
MVSEDIIVKYLAGEAEQHEIVMLENWRKDSDDNEKQFRQVAQLWELASETRKQPKLNVEAAWQKVSQGIQNKSEVKVVSFYRPWMAIAASLVVLLGIALWLFKPGDDVSKLMSAVAEND